MENLLAMNAAFYCMSPQIVSEFVYLIIHDQGIDLKQLNVLCQYSVLTCPILWS